MLDTDKLLDEISSILLTLQVTVDSLLGSEFTPDEALCLDSKILEMKMDQSSLNLISSHFKGVLLSSESLRRAFGFKLSFRPTAHLDVVQCRQRINSEWANKVLRPLLLEGVSPVSG